MKTTTALLGVVAACVIAIPAHAQSFNKGSHLNSSGQSKVNKALAKGWAAGDPNVTSEGRTVVNVGSHKSGNCTVNVGTTQKSNKPGQQAPKEVVVTAKEIINVCK